VVKHHSFSAAADELGLSKSSVSKQIRALEDRLGARLLDRTTRRMRLTEVGAAFHDRCAAIVTAAEEAELAVTQLQMTPRGRLRISAPVSLGQRYLTDVVDDYLTLYPDVEIELDLSDRFVDLVDEGYDLAIRVGALPDSSLVARKLADSRRVVVGSPSYLADHGVPQTPADVGAHECLLYTYSQVPADVWRFDGPDGEISIRVHGRLRTNNGDVLAAAAGDGIGIAMLPDFIVAAELRAGRLQAALSDMCQSLGGIYAVYPHNRHLSANVRLFVDELVATFASR